MEKSVERRHHGSDTLLRTRPRWQEWLRVAAAARSSADGVERTLMESLATGDRIHLDSIHITFDPGIIRTSRVRAEISGSPRGR